MTDKANKKYNSRSKGPSSIIFGQRFNEILDIQGYPRKGTGRTVTLAQNFGVSVSAARKWVEGIAIPGYDKLLAITRAFHVSTDWLLGNDQFVPKGQVIALDLTKEREELNHQQAAIKREIQKLHQLKSKLNLSSGLNDEVVFVPVLNGQNHLQSTPCDIKLLPFPSAWLEIKESSLGHDIAIVEVTLDAMSPTLNSGDKVLIDLTTNSLQSNALYIFLLNNHFLIRRVFTA